VRCLLALEGACRAYLDGELGRVAGLAGPASPAAVHDLFVRGTPGGSR
jgi:hypothetical protein